MEHLIAIVVSAMAFAVMAATPCPVVVIPDMPTEVEKFAAAELAGELGRCLGEVPEIVYKGVWKHELTKETSELLGFKAAGTDTRTQRRDIRVVRHLNPSKELLQRSKLI